LKASYPDDKATGYKLGDVRACIYYCSIYELEICFSENLLEMPWLIVFVG